jgi:hypothetical protein
MFSISAPPVISTPFESVYLILLFVTIMAVLFSFYVPFYYFTKRLYITSDSD